MLEQLREQQQLVVAVAGDGAGDQVGARASRGPDGTIAIVVWNGTADVTKCAGEPLLDRDLTLTVSDLPAERYWLHHRRLDERHSNLNRAWQEIGQGRDWPDEAEWAALRRADELAEYEPQGEVRLRDGSITRMVALPMPSVSLIELTPMSAG